MLKTNPALLLAGAATVSAFVAASIEHAGWPQQPLFPASRFSCDLPPHLDPAGDGLPSALELFSSHEAIERQVKRHQAVVRVPTVSYDDLGSFDRDERWKPFHEFHDVLAKTYPTLHKHAKVEKINTFGLLFTIQGSDHSLKPLLLMAHQDVVPVADESTWKYPPFKAVYDGTRIWGRGSSDDKNSLTAIMSALESLLSNRAFRSPRTILLSLGFDEERSGYLGAGPISDVLFKRYGENGIAAILDEGGGGVEALGDVLYALPAVTEKGHVDVWLELSVAGGHSSTPFPHTGIGIMAEIVSALEAHPYEARLVEDSPVHRHLQCQARYSRDERPDIASLIEKHDLHGAAEYLVHEGRQAQFLIQTSQAVDFISGGQKINAMPEKIKIGVNYRVSHHDSIAQVQHNIVRYTHAIVEKYGLSVKAYHGDTDYAEFISGELASENTQTTQSAQPAPDVDYNGVLVLTTTEKSLPAPISPTSGPVWDLLAGTIRHTFAPLRKTVVPSGVVMAGNTDTRHFQRLTKHIYRFTPDRYADSNVHTVDEHIHVDGHMDMVRFYYDFVRNFEAASV